jgi:hypothetical protein
LHTRRCYGYPRCRIGLQGVPLRISPHGQLYFLKLHNNTNSAVRTMDLFQSRHIHHTKQ